ncbi:hypothetical protein ZOSMA_96G00060 [Zostera marina]|uniref:Uncharacterized protein n=1 Tax=Zostera marina TaxID=29655 RepID=A0A0K9NI77_ZOSMR|nr:hypothetical protein ZOSMA_96G00060 [Zostera marina]
MRKCRDSVVRRKRTKDPSKVYIDGCDMCLMVWLFKHTLVAKPNEQAVSNEPYFKKWGGKITYLKEKLDLLTDSEVFIEDISFEKRLNMAPTVGSLIETGSSASASVEESMSEKNNVEQFGCSSAEKRNDSEIRRKLKGKRVMIYESPRNHSKSASKIKNVAEDRREVQKRAIAIKFEEIFKKKPGMTSPKKVVKKKKDIPSVSLRRNGRLSNTSATSSGPPCSEPIDIDVMEIVEKKQHVGEDAAKISMDLNDPVVGEVDKKMKNVWKRK